MTESRSLARLLWTCSGGLMAVYLLVFGLRAAMILGLPVEQVYGEAIVLEEARRVPTDQLLYPPATGLPLTVSAYTPLYYLLVGSLQRLIGDRGYAVGRAVSLGATVCTAGLLAWSVRSIHGRWRGGLLAAGLFLTQNLAVLLWAPLHRVDTLGLAFTVAGLALAAGGRPVLAAVPLALALLTKQTFLSGPIAVCLTLALAREWRTLLRFAAALGGPLVAAMAAVQLATHGWFAWHTLAANANPIDFEYFAVMLGVFLQFNALPVCLAAALFSQPALARERLWRAEFLLSLVQVLATIGKLGASSNYWLEASAATAALIGVLVARRLPADSSASLPFRQTGLAACVLASLLMGVPAYQANATQILERYVVPEKVLWQLPVAAHIASEPGELLTDDPGLALLASKPIQFECVIFTILAAQGVWDEWPILEAIRTRRFSLIVLTESLDHPPQRLIAARWTERVRQTMRESYAEAGYESGYWWYRPRVDAAQPAD